jgi:hypothetical protein
MTNQDNNRDALIAHVQALDTIIRKRNETIAELNREISRLTNDPIDLGATVQKKIDAAFKKGWRDCYRQVQQVSAQQRVRLLDELKWPE